MENEQTDKTNTEGKDSNTKTEADKPLSLYDKTEAIVTRQETANKTALEILERQEKLHANQRLAGTGGGHIEAKTQDNESDHDYRKRVTKEMAAGKTEFGN